MQYRKPKTTQPHEIYKNVDTSPPFAESLAKLIHRNDKEHHTKKILRELQLSNAKNIVDTKPLLCR